MRVCHEEEILQKIRKKLEMHSGVTIHSITCPLCIKRYARRSTKQLVLKGTRIIENVSGGEGAATKGLQTVGVVCVVFFFERFV